MASESADAPSSLLLVPPPDSFDYNTVKEAFELSVSDVLLKLSEAVHGSNRIASVDVALGIPNLLSNRYKPRSRVFNDLQQYLASIYTLIGAVAAVRDIELDAPGGIDARVIFLDYSPPVRAGDPHDDSFSRTKSQVGPSVDIATLGGSGRRWDHIFYPNNEAGKMLVKDFAECFGHFTNQTREHVIASAQAVSCRPYWGLPNHISNLPERNNRAMTDNASEEKMLTPHYSVAVGGTFDHLHLGHKLLLTATALALESMEKPGDKLDRVMYIGITGDALLVNKKYAEFLESWEERYQRTASFVSSIMHFTPEYPMKTERVNEKVVNVTHLRRLVVKFVEITDPFGPTITEEDITALVVSAETHTGGAAVNDKRAEKGWSKLEVFEVDVLQSDARLDSKISSTDIRRRRMDRAKV